MTLPGRLSFAWESPTRGGGIAFFSPSPSATVRATAYLVTARQFCDVFAQEMWREPGVDLDLAPVLEGGSHAVGPGRYETLHAAGVLEAVPVLTFSCPDVAELELLPPAASYLATMARGLRATHELTTVETVDYLLATGGITYPDGAEEGSDTTWDRQSLTALVTSVAP